MNSLDTSECAELAGIKSLPNSITWMQLHKFAELIAARAVQEGYVIVPIEPTEEMIKVMALEYDPTWGYPSRGIGDEWAKASYKSMINEAQK